MINKIKKEVKYKEKYPGRNWANVRVFIVRSRYPMGFNQVWQNQLKFFMNTKLCKVGDLAFGHLP